MKREVMSLNFGKWMTEKRRANGMCQSDLANILQVQQHTISRWETGETSPKLDMVEEICRTFGAELILREKENDE